MMQSLSGPKGVCYNGLGRFLMVYAGVMNNKHASSILMAQRNTVPLKDSHVYQTIYDYLIFVF